MDILGENLKLSREEKGLSIEEVSKDLNAKKEDIESIENGSISAFKDVYVLKDLIYNYAKYLGFNTEEVMDDFNEFMFQTTSKIPTDVIERISKQKEKEEKKQAALSPYTEDLGTYKDSNNNKKITMFIIIVCVMLLALFILLNY